MQETEGTATPSRPGAVLLGMVRGAMVELPPPGAERWAWILRFSDGWIPKELMRFGVPTEEFDVSCQERMAERGETLTEARAQLYEQLRQRHKADRDMKGHPGDVLAIAGDGVTDEQLEEAEKELNRAAASALDWLQNCNHEIEEDW